MEIAAEVTTPNDSSQDYFKSISHSVGKNQYEGTLSLGEGNVKIFLKKRMEPLFWEREITLSDLASTNKLWKSLLDEEFLFQFILSAFENSALKLTMADTTELDIAFEYQMGFKKVLLPLRLKRGKFDTEKIVIEQGKIIKELHEKIAEVGAERDCLRAEMEKEKELFKADVEKEKEVLKAEIEKFKEEAKGVKQSTEMCVVGFDPNGNDYSTCNTNFMNMGIKQGTITMKRNGQVKWDLHINGLWTDYAGGYVASFRLALTNLNTGTVKCWPSDSGAKQVMYGYGSSTLCTPFHYSDVAELEEGKYNVNLQWCFSTGSYTLYYYYSYGDIKLIATINYK